MTWIRLIDVGDCARSSLVAEGGDGYSGRLKCDVDKTDIGDGAGSSLVAEGGDGGYSGRLKCDVDKTYRCCGWCRVFVGS